MSRKPLYRSTQLPYHVFNRVNNREWFHLPLHETWRIFAEECYAISLASDVRIHALVLMSNHFHMLISTPTTDLGEVMQCLAGSVTRSCNLKSGREGHLFTGRYKWSLIESALYYAHVLKYVYRNPVRAGLSDRVEDYPYSTLRGLLGQSHLPFPVWHPLQDCWKMFVPSDSQEFLRWLNTPFGKENTEAMRKGLRRKIFQLPKVGSARKPSTLETGLT